MIKSDSKFYIGVDERKMFAKEVFDNLEKNICNYIMNNKMPRKYVIKKWYRTNKSINSKRGIGRTLHCFIKLEMI